MNFNMFEIRLCEHSAGATAAAPPAASAADPAAAPSSTQAATPAAAPGATQSNRAYGDSSSKMARVAGRGDGFL